MSQVRGSYVAQAGLEFIVLPDVLPYPMLFLCLPFFPLVFQNGGFM